MMVIKPRDMYIFRYEDIPPSVEVVGPTQLLINNVLVEVNYGECVKEGDVVMPLDPETRGIPGGQQEEEKVDAGQGQNENQEIQSAPYPECQVQVQNEVKGQQQEYDEDDVGETIEEIEAAVALVVNSDTGDELIPLPLPPTTEGEGTTSSAAETMETTTTTTEEVEVCHHGGTGFCSKGCICSSLSAGHVARDHCGKKMCLFECNCLFPANRAPIVSILDGEGNIRRRLRPRVTLMNWREIMNKSGLVTPPNEASSDSESNHGGGGGKLGATTSASLKRRLLLQQHHNENSPKRQKLLMVATKKGQGQKSVTTTSPTVGGGKKKGKTMVTTTTPKQVEQQMRKSGSLIVGNNKLPIKLTKRQGQLQAKKLAAPKKTPTPTPTATSSPIKPYNRMMSMATTAAAVVVTKRTTTKTMMSAKQRRSLQKKIHSCRGCRVDLEPMTVPADEWWSRADVRNMEESW